MIDFRYHLVSIIGIFLALAVGIVLGTTALNGPVLDDLRGRIDDLSASGIAAAVERAALDFGGHEPSDDTAVLVVRVPVAV